MPNLCYPLFVTLVLGPAIAQAQPLFQTEADWTFLIDKRRFGLQQVWQMPGEFRSTQVWLGRYRLDIGCRVETVIAEALLSPPRLLARIIRWRSLRRLE